MSILRTVAAREDGKDNTTPDIEEDEPPPKKKGPGWKNIDAINRKRYAERVKKEWDEERRAA